MTERKILTAEEIEAFKKKHIRSFTLRRGHISQAQKRALEELLPRYAVEYKQELINTNEVFGRQAPLVLEIGCGMGETTALIAQMHPEVDFLGCEVFSAGVGALAKRLDEMTLKNVVNYDDEGKSLCISNEAGESVILEVKKYGDEWLIEK